MMKADELVVLRQQTLAFIALDATTVSLVPQEIVITEAGGRKKQAMPSLPPQTFKFITQSDFSGVISAQDGIVRKYDYVMLGAHDADIPLEAQWIDDNGQRWQVVGLMPDNEYEKKALVRSVGGSPES